MQSVDPKKWGGCDDKWLISKNKIMGVLCSGGFYNDSGRLMYFDFLKGLFDALRVIFDTKIFS